jgi:hypothetical protein
LDLPLISFTSSTLPSTVGLQTSRTRAVIACSPHPPAHHGLDPGVLHHLHHRPHVHATWPTQPASTCNKDACRALVCD